MSSPERIAVGVLKDSYKTLVRCSDSAYCIARLLRKQHENDKDSQGEHDRGIAAHIELIVEAMDSALEEARDAYERWISTSAEDQAD